MSKRINDEELIDEFSLVKEFLDEVTKKLPIWLKTNTEELKDVLEELESHIWDKASELAQSEEPQIQHVQEAIILMGNPRNIAREYRKRGNPKFYITEELWPWYYKTLIFVGVIVVFVNLLTMAFTIGKEPAGQVVGQMFEGMFTGFAIGFAAISLIFVQLSMHGFLPKDLKVDKIKLTKEIKIKTKPRKPKKAKRVIPSQGAYLFEAIMGLTFGILLLVFPFFNFNEYYAFDMIYLVPWLRYFGGILVISGCIRFSQALIGDHLRMQQLFLGVYLVPQSLTIALFLQLHYNTNILRDPLLAIFPGADIQLYILIGVIFVAVITALAMITEISKIVRLEFKGFTEEDIRTA